MKLKTLAIIISAIFIILFIGICVIIVNNSNTDVSNNVTAKTNSEIKEQSFNGENYASNPILKEITNSEMIKLNHEIIDISNFYLCTKDKVYSMEDCKECFQSTKQIKKIYYTDLEGSIIILQNSDNSYSLNIKKEEYGETYKEFNNMDLENTVRAEIDYKSGELVFVRKNSNNKYYADVYKIYKNRDEIEIKKTKEKLPLIYQNDSYNIGDIKDIYSSPYGVLFSIGNGKIYRGYYGHVEYIRNTSNEGYRISCSDDDALDKLYNNEKLENIEKIWGSYDTGSYYIEFTNDKNSLYELGMQQDNVYLYKRNFPNNYTTKDIKNVIGGLSNAIIEFNDSAICTVKKENTSELILDKELTSLNKKNKIKNIALDEYMSFKVLMDDNCIYELQN